MYCKNSKTMFNLETQSFDKNYKSNDKSKLNNVHAN